MKPKRHLFSVDTLLVFLALACVALSVFLALLKPQYLLYIAAGLVVLALLALLVVQQVRRALRKLMGGKEPDVAGSVGLATMGVPVVALRGKTILWYNEAFKTEICGGRDVGLAGLGQLVPGLSVQSSICAGGQNIALGERLYTAYGSASAAEGDLYMLFFIENTALKTQAAEYLASRPSVIYFVVDTYDEILKEIKESERALIMAEIDRALEQYVGRTSGFLRRVTASRYMAVVEERHVQQMIHTRFDILDEVRRTGEEAPNVTLSIGVGRFGLTFKECEDMALQALDMALGRGGDQAAVNGPNGFEFYGGVSRSVEKRTKVKSRIIAKAIKDLMEKSDRVLIMGHKNADMDALGAGIGMLRFARICGKQASIVINHNRNLVPALLEALQQGGYGDDLISPDEAIPATGANTMLVVVDTHMKYLLESEDVYNLCGTVVVIDHHRRMVGHIDNAVIFYHEPYASSTSELVSELLQYAGDTKDDRPTPLEAEALLAGIMLDTRTFSLHTGVRTFEAAAYLRRMGAQTEVVKRFFSTSMDDYVYRSHLVAQAKLYKGCAVAISDRIPVDCEVVAPQAANDLLTIDGVQASIVAIKQGEEIRISARSMGQVNVQLMMEKIGGGGHLTMAGAQLQNTGVQQAEQIILDAIEQYWREQTAVRQA